MKHDMGRVGRKGVKGNNTKDLANPNSKNGIFPSKIRHLFSTELEKGCFGEV
jgi:hypothetical protein